jgi:GT2 family glycosyltransferase
MAGNLSVRRDRAIAVGGFDENFVGTAFRFETEFCRRLIAAGGRVLFQPTARILHLRAPRGGTRSYGNHLTSASAAHGVGDYYFALRGGLTVEALAYIAWRPLRQVRTRFHLRRPWWIAPKLVGEMRALAWAIRLARRGPRLLSTTTRTPASVA